MAQERQGAVTMRGNPLTLIGPEIKPGQKAPAFTVVDNNLAPVNLEQFKGMVKIICSVPSLDTPVCDAETRQFNVAASKLPSDVRILTISVDLPFAQKRWCGAAGVDKVITLSDHRNVEFGEKYGVLVKDLRILARAVFVVDKHDNVVHAEYVKELTSYPDYEAALDAARKAAAAA
jgi:thiol peroxidase